MYIALQPQAWCVFLQEFLLGLCILPAQHRVARGISSKLSQLDYVPGCSCDAHVNPLAFLAGRAAWLQRFEEATRCDHRHEVLLVHQSYVVGRRLNDGNLLVEVPGYGILGHLPGLVVGAERLGGAAVAARFQNKVLSLLAAEPAALPVYEVASGASAQLWSSLF